MNKYDHENNGVIKSLGFTVDDFERISNRLSNITERIINECKNKPDEIISRMVESLELVCLEDQEFMRFIISMFTTQQLKEAQKEMLAKSILDLFKGNM